MWAKEKGESVESAVEGWAGRGLTARQGTDASKKFCVPPAVAVHAKTRAKFITEQQTPPTVKSEASDKPLTVTTKQKTMHGLALTAERRVSIR
eukprot:jgi/Chlat1/5381/Chrsp35S05293